MIIRCPNCEYSRTININNVPPTAEMATCPKCKHRFRFRTLETSVDHDVDALKSPPPPPPTHKETSQGMDIWDAMDALQLRWEKNLEEHVADINVKEAAMAADSDKEETPHQDHTENAGEENSPPQLIDREDTQKNNPSFDTSDDLAPYAEENELPSHTDSQDELSTQTTPQVIDYEELPPEERVERDMKFLKDEGERPMRDLGMLKEYDTIPPSAPAQPDMAAPIPPVGRLNNEQGVVPWENPGSFGWLRAFYLTVHEAMLNPPSFFARIRSQGSLGPGYLFFLILGYAAVLSSVLWIELAVLLLPTLGEHISSRGNTLSMLLLAPFALGLLQIAVAGSISAMQKFFSSTHSDFPLIFKVVSYSVAPLILSLIPFVGPVVGAVWFLVSLLTGCRYALGLSLPLAVAVTLLPALILIYSVVWYFI